MAVSVDKLRSVTKVQTTRVVAIEIRPAQMVVEASVTDSVFAALAWRRGVGRVKAWCSDGVCNITLSERVSCDERNGTKLLRGHVKMNRGNSRLSDVGCVRDYYRRDVVDCGSEWRSHVRSNSTVRI